MTLNDGDDENCGGAPLEMRPSFKVSQSESRNRFLVILKKRAPTFDGLRISWCPLHPAGDGSLGYLKAQHEQLAVNARRAPGWVLRHHTEDQLSNFRRQFPPTDLFFYLRDQAPVESKTSAMPANHSFGSDH